MGLIRSIKGAVSGTLGDQWKEFFYCDAMPPEVLVTRGIQRTDSRSVNRKGTDNIISHGSVVAVGEGQAMAICCNGKIVEFTAEAGEFRWDSGGEPSVFHGSLGSRIVGTFRSVAQRFAFGGQAPKDHRVFYFNLLEIKGNKYGTPQPVPFRVVDNNIGLDIDISIRCNGVFSYRMIDPIRFFTSVSGNVATEYRRNEALDNALRSELLTALQPAFARISAQGIRYSALPGHTMEIADALNEVLDEKWGTRRGIAVAAFGVNTVSASPEDEKLIRDWQVKGMMARNPGMAGAALVNAQANAMQAAAANQGGAMMGFAGLNMAQGAGGMNAGQFFGMQQQQQMQQQQMQPQGGWRCQCGFNNQGRFCGGCGAQQPQPQQQQGWQCQCGTANQGRFCGNCGGQQPQ